MWKLSERGYIMLEVSLALLILAAAALVCSAVIGAYGMERNSRHLEKTAAAYLAQLSLADAEAKTVLDVEGVQWKVASYNAEPFTEVCLYNKTHKREIRNCRYFFSGPQSQRWNYDSGPRGVPGSHDNHSAFYSRLCGIGDDSDRRAWLSSV